MLTLLSSIETPHAVAYIPMTILLLGTVVGQMRTPKKHIANKPLDVRTVSNTEQRKNDKTQSNKGDTLLPYLFTSKISGSIEGRPGSRMMHAMHDVAHA